jgi:hypothetical protein
LPGLGGSGRFGGTVSQVANLKRDEGLGTVLLRWAPIDTLKAEQRRHCE